MEHMRGLSALLVCVLAAAGAGCEARPQVWFAPDVASSDMRQLFSHPERWSESRGETTVFTFYESQVGGFGPCPDCGPNTLDGLSAVYAFAWLRLWHIDTALSAAAVKEWDCQAETTTG